MRRHNTQERAAIAARVAARFSGPSHQAARRLLCLVGPVGKRRVIWRGGITARERADIRRTVRQVARQERAILDAVGKPEEMEQRRAVFGRLIASLFRQARRFGSYGVNGFSAGEAARHLTLAGETRRAYGGAEWGKSSTRDSLEWARQWNQHAAGRLPR